MSLMSQALSGGNSKWWFLRLDVGFVILFEALQIYISRRLNQPLIRRLVAPPPKSKLKPLLRSSTQAVSGTKWS
jgi:hypothetical protein